MNNITINIGDKKLIATTGLFDDIDDFNIDRILSIDYRNLIKEVLTFPVILNRLGFLVVQSENEVREAELDLRIWKAKKRKKVRKDFEDDIVSKDSSRKKYTLDEVDDAMRSDPMYKVKYSTVYRRQKNFEYVNSIYWAAKAKSDTLLKLSLSLQHDIQSDNIDVSDLVGEFNSVELNIRGKKV